MTNTTEDSWAIQRLINAVDSNMDTFINNFHNILISKYGIKGGGKGEYGMEWYGPTNSFNIVENTDTALHGFFL